MSKVFEDYFSELQADMVSICLEYIKSQGDKIYIYCSNENNVYYVGYFYEINGKLKERHKIHEALPNCNTSEDLQRQVMKILIDNLKKIEDVCKKFDRPIPTEMKLVYDIQQNNLKAKYQYVSIFTKDDEKSADDIEEEWFQEIRVTLSNSLE